MFIIAEEAKVSVIGFIDIASSFKEEGIIYKAPGSF